MWRSPAVTYPRHGCSIAGSPPSAPPPKPLRRSTSRRSSPVPSLSCLAWQPGTHFGRTLHPLQPCRGIQPDVHRRHPHFSHVLSTQLPTFFCERNEPAQHRSRRGLSFPQSPEPVPHSAPAAGHNPVDKRSPKALAARTGYSPGFALTPRAAHPTHRRSHRPAG
jgi:hypothetical protein